MEAYRPPEAISAVADEGHQGDGGGMGAGIKGIQHLLEATADFPHGTGFPGHLRGYKFVKSVMDVVDGLKGGKSFSLGPVFRRSCGVLFRRVFPGDEFQAMTGLNHRDAPW